jgi:hypothetical protein
MLDKKHCSIHELCTFGGELDSSFASLPLMFTALSSAIASESVRCIRYPFFTHFSPLAARVSLLSSKRARLMNTTLYAKKSKSKPKSKKVNFFPTFLVVLIC